MHWEERERVTTSTEVAVNRVAFAAATVFASIFVVLVPCLQILRMSILIIIDSSCKLIISFFNTSLCAVIKVIKDCCLLVHYSSSARSPSIKRTGDLATSNNHRHLCCCFAFIAVYVDFLRAHTHSHSLYFTPLSTFISCRRAFHL